MVWTGHACKGQHGLSRERAVSLENMAQHFGQTSQWGAHPFAQLITLQVPWPTAKAQTGQGKVDANRHVPLKTQQQLSLLADMAR